MQGIHLLLLSAALVVGCGGGPDDEYVPAPADSPDTVATVGDSTASSVRTPDAGVAEDPFAAFDVPAPGEAVAERRSVALLLRNSGRSLALVYADGGAGEVFLDSVPAGESRRVDLRTRAGLVRLRSEAPDGSPLRRTEVTPGMPTVHEVIVADTPRAP